ncbi:putative DUF2407 C-terminal domain containing protein [Lyophyllum shimeji]|uniref:DUF2407 C-terminal domain containing protein n=1 Tax=Lyophyllum shimeji TaxID=47721 RepID=A0A9P3PL91_LYOSH|nr:putative DUF2407 C-terminal domain containing protein [Lyophyllum shimeji]
MLSEKAKGKQRALEPPHPTDSPPVQPELPAQQARDLVIRFTEGLPDLVIGVSQQDAVRDVKRKIRDARPELKDRRLRLIHSGRLLTEGTYLYFWLTSLEEKQNRAAPEEANDTPQSSHPQPGTTWMHCSVGPKFAPGEAEDESRIQTAQLKPARGFDRLASVGFSEADIANFRRQFHSQSSSNYLDLDFDTEEEYDEHARALEEQWIDSMDNAGTASMSQSSPSNTTVLQGIVLGFFFPLIPFFFMRQQKPAVFWDDGSEYEPPGNVIFSRRMQMGMTPTSSKLSPIHTIPPEILDRIFRECLPLDGPVLCSRSAAPVVISQVCGDWRALVFRQSCLWSSLKVVISPFSPAPPDCLLHSWLARSGSQPLTLSLELDKFPPVANNLILIAKSVLRGFLAKSFLWRVVSFVLPGSYGFLRPVFNHPVPKLETLGLALRNWHRDEIDDVNRFLLHAPRLRQFSWSNRPTWGSWDRPLDDVVSPQIDWRNLTHLTYDAWLPFQTSYGILQQCANLVVCDLRRFGIGDASPDPTSSQTLFLPCLRTLKVYENTLDEGLGLLMDVLLCPSLCALSVTCGRRDAVEWPQTQLISLLSRSSCTLAALCLEHTGITEGELIQCLQMSHASLACLEVYDTQGTVCAGDRLLSLLTHGGDDEGVCCPNLTNLTLHGATRSTDGALARMLQSRWPLLEGVDIVLLGENSTNEFDLSYLKLRRRGRGVKWWEERETGFRVPTLEG